MVNQDPLAPRGRALEDPHFHKKEQELREKLRLRAAMQATRRQLSEPTGIVDDDVLQTLHELGYTQNTVALLHLVRLIQVGWANGNVTADGRDLILEAARLRGVLEGSLAYKQLESWLESRPDEDFFERTLLIINDLVQQSQEQARSRHGLFTQCIRIAAASGRILGLGSKISDEEMALLERISNAIGAWQRGDLE